MFRNPAIRRGGGIVVAARLPRDDPALRDVVMRAKKRTRDSAKEDAAIRLVWSHLGGHLRAMIEKKAPNEASAVLGDRPEIALGEFLKYGHPAAYDSIDTMLRVRENAAKGLGDIYRLRAHARTLGSERSVVIHLGGKTDVTKSNFIEILSQAEVDGKVVTAAQWQATGSRAIERTRLEFEEYFIADVKPGTPPKKNEFGFQAMDYHVPSEDSDDYLVIVKVMVREAIDVRMGRSEIFKDTVQPAYVPFAEGHKIIEQNFGSERAAARWMMTTSSASTLVFIVPRRTR